MGQFCSAQSSKLPAVSEGGAVGAERLCGEVGGLGQGCCLDKSFEVRVEGAWRSMSMSWYLAPSREAMRA